MDDAVGELVTNRTATMHQNFGAFGLLWMKDVLKMNELKHELNRLNNPMNWILGR